MSERYVAHAILSYDLETKKPYLTRRLRNGYGGTPEEAKNMLTKELGPDYGGLEIQVKRSISLTPPPSAARDLVGLLAGSDASHYMNQLAKLENQTPNT